MKTKNFEALNEDLFTALSPGELCAVGGITGVTTFRLTFVSPTLTDRFIDEKIDS